MWPLLLAACAPDETPDLSGTWLFFETTIEASGDCEDEVGNLALHWLVLGHDTHTGELEGRRLHEPGDNLLNGQFAGGRALLTVGQAEIPDGVEHIDYNLVYVPETDSLEGRADWLRRDDEGEVVCRNFTAEVKGGR